MTGSAPLRAALAAAPGTGMDDELAGRPLRAVPTHVFARPPLDAVTHDGVADFARDGHADPRFGLARRQEQQKVLGLVLSPALLNREVLGALAQPRRLRKRLGLQRRYFFAIDTVRRLRPLARRRLSTA